MLPVSGIYSLYVQSITRSFTVSATRRMVAFGRRQNRWHYAAPRFKATGGNDPARVEAALDVEYN